MGNDTSKEEAKKVLIDASFGRLTEKVLQDRLKRINREDRKEMMREVRRVNAKRGR